MCTLIVVTRALPGRPLVVGANRDERLDRPSAPPAWSAERGVRVLAPRDLEAGGTWLGVNEHGLLVAITNRFGRPPDPARRSRGHLVAGALGARSAAEAFATAQAVDPLDYNGFHLLLASAAEAFLVRGDGERLVSESLAPGLHLITERSFGAAPTARVPLLEAAIAARPLAEIDAWLPALLAEHGPGGIEGVCVHDEARGYGSRSAAIVELAPDRFRFADGRPCRAPFVDVR